MLTLAAATTASLPRPTITTGAANPVTKSDHFVLVPNLDRHSCLTRSYLKEERMNTKTVCRFGLLLALQMASGPKAFAAVHALFDLRTPASGPFPSDWFTVVDRSNNTRLRVNLPRPDCEVRTSDCEFQNVIHTLDGFNLAPRLSIPFDGPIDVRAVTSGTVFLISLGSTLSDDDNGEHGGRVI